MTWDPLALVFLGTIAVASLVQTAVLLGLAAGMYKARRRADELGARMEAELRPHLERAAEIGAHVQQLTEAAVRQIPEVERTVEETARRVRHVGEVAERFFVRPLTVGAVVLTLFRAFRGGSPAALLNSREQ